MRNFFVFTSKADQYVYDRLCDTVCEESTERLVAAGRAECEKDTDEAEPGSKPGDGEIADYIGSKFRDWISENAPLGAGLNEAGYANDVYGDLLSHAMAQVDYRRVAMAFLEDVKNDIHGHALMRKLRDSAPAK